MEITPKIIREVLKNVSPYQEEDIIKHYLGQKICWDLSYCGVTKLNEGFINIFLQEDSNIVCCKINEKDFPSIKVMPKNTMVRLVGVISEISTSVITIKEAHLQEIKDNKGQIYFSAGSREELLAFLISKVLGANDIKIYDSYPSEDILKLLESASSQAEIHLLGKSIDATFAKQIQAFNTYFKKNMIAKKIDISHARFYIIDDEVLQVDSSLKNLGGNKATTVNIIEKEAAEAIKQDYEKWWKEALKV